MKTSNAGLNSFNNNRQVQPIQLPIKAIFSKISQRLIRFLASNHEPQIWLKKDRYGNVFWHVYDPASGASAHLSSEAEVRMWLEQRYSNPTL